MRIALFFFALFVSILLFQSHSINVVESNDLTELMEFCKINFKYHALKEVNKKFDKSSYFFILENKGKRAIRYYVINQSDDTEVTQIVEPGQSKGIHILLEGEKNILLVSQSKLRFGHWDVKGTLTIYKEIDEEKKDANSRN